MCVLNVLCTGSQSRAPHFICIKAIQVHCQLVVHLEKWTSHAVQFLQIQESIRSHIPSCNFPSVYILFVLLALALLHFSSTAPNKNQQVLLLSTNTRFITQETSMSSAAADYLHAFRMRPKNTHCENVVQNSVPGPISMIQIPFCRA